jgi:hypothetical protein
MYAEYHTGEWHIQTIGSAYAIGGQTSLDLDSSELPHIAYWDYTHLAVKYAHDTGSS